MKPFVAEAIGPQGFGKYRITVMSQTVQWEPTSEPPECYFSPGWVDLHVHGGWGIDFMSASAAEMRALDNAFLECGYEAYLPTTVTASASAVVRALEILNEADHAVGFHLEGPFISRMYPGAQNRDAIADIKMGDSSWESDWGKVLDHPDLRLVTLAPELRGALQLTKHLAGRGVRVSMGHSDATCRQAGDCYAAGATQATHLFNAMRGIHHRELGLAGFALLEDNLWVEVIADGHHLSTDALQLVFKSKPSNRVLAVSDGTKGIGMKEGSETVLWGRTARIEQGSIRFNDGTLAGSTITLLDAFRRLASDFGPETAIRACSLNPRSVLGMDEPARYLMLNRELDLVESWWLKAL